MSLVILAIDLTSSGFFEKRILPLAKSATIALGAVIATPRL
jgi:hypothetical protein